MSRHIAALAAILIVAIMSGVTSNAQVNLFVGSWRGITTANGMPVTINLVMGADQSYSELVQSGSIMTRQSGSYTFASNNVIVRQVLDWEPKTQTQPPGGTFKFQFTSPNSFTLQDVRLHGVMTFNRVQ
jgi:hypothetical protein